MRSGSRYGTGSKNTERAKLKIAVFAPMPSARLSTTRVEKPGARRSLRKAARRSRVRVSTLPLAIDSPGESLTSRSRLGKASSQQATTCRLCSSSSRSQHVHARLAEEQPTCHVPSRRLTRRRPADCRLWCASCSTRGRTVRPGDNRCPQSDTSSWVREAFRSR